ncbi:UDP-N-acetylmuramoyl-L-alanyl-D-glutamate--2,6-diaminopimelate ligase [Youhaiella tibetensis]|uniref:UDP-N-acetylmuramoyl-L-alanyl-D-glutamate--2,6-diaminopimelate ligase n=1 Tax=Paradevosia tibetensis TaxID=1447062 RepID=A0A5B9DR25_9HYPH|nr:UDP-N-acetylmuramoyl-L-alanyl-D-glutamate--2,6-diaminopimelate ligase [Youhaiella tibetensis]QEE21405.1 UDP-N-acetylmuramoyl-L-alanyl-D-glutamate--2,6-diaminopimelate ligase [Youhaiella tibetensis]GGF15315.1 UDP-N-acetylmuramoyl-L-alanyl-D-glutamate--2,6-diaminopimelate ligase [Youhaiella tibetensis]
MLLELLKDAVAVVPEGLPGIIKGVNADSRAIQKGEVFFALPGQTVHGDKFVEQAAKRGAVAMVTDREPPADPGIPVLVVDDVRAAYARAAARTLAPQPEVAVAVTGTNGKTSVASFVRQIWAANGFAAASVGTLGIETASGLEAGQLTTPDALSLHRSLAALKSKGVDHVALEASSQGLDQRRVDGIRFQAVGFTNLTDDHLEYHHGMEGYREAKLRLFKELLIEGGSSVINTDDPEHMPFLFASLDRGATLLTVGTEGAFFEISKIQNKGFGQLVTGRLVGEPVEFLLPLTGAFQVSNVAVALGMAMATGAVKEKSIPALNKLKGAKGRLELVAEHNGGAVFVDYAHTPDALKNALESLRPYAKGKLIVVFGAGGDRDKAKRPQMGAIAKDLADRVIVTDDNPRTENAASIRAQILEAVGNAEEIGDRAEAIRAAVATIKPNDVVLIAGKGHEDYQIIGTLKHHFSDHQVVLSALKGL